MSPAIRRFLKTERPMKQWLLILLLISGARLVSIVVLLPTAPMIPDENIYAFLTTSIVLGNDLGFATHYIGFGPTILTGSGILLSVASGFAAVGLDSFSAIRLSSLLSSTVSALALVHVVALSRRFSLSSTGIPIRSGGGIALLTYLLMPSHMLWSSMGLRDASAELCAVTAAWGFFQLNLQRSHLWRICGGSALFLGTAGIYLSRSSLAPILSIALVAALTCPPWKRRVVPIVAGLAIVILGNVAGDAARNSTPIQPFQTTPRIEHVQKALDAQNVTETTIPQSQEVVKIPTPPPRQIGRNLFETRENFRVNADSAFTTNYCQEDWGSLIRAVACETLHAPLGIYRFLATPNLLDSGFNIPAQRLFAGLENMLWVLLMATALGSLLARFPMQRRLLLLVGLFLSFAILAYALISGNEGTAFRHKGQLLWAWCLILALGYGWRPWARRLLVKASQDSRKTHT